MTQVTPTQASPASDLRDDEDFNTLVLNYLQEQHPSCPFNKLMQQLTTLQPGTNMTDLQVALCYADTIMRNDPAEAQYVTDYVDPAASRITGVKMIMDNMLLGTGRTDDAAPAELDYGW